MNRVRQQAAQAASYASRSQPKSVVVSDAQPINHTLFVRVLQKGESDEKSRGMTIEILKYISSRVAAIKKMGIRLRVKKLTRAHLESQDGKLKKFLKSIGVKQLPALLTADSAYNGPTPIKNIYETNIREFIAVMRREDAKVIGSAPEGTPESALEDLYRSEMTLENAEEDSREAGIGDESDMMDKYRSHMQRRDESTARAKRARSGEAEPKPVERKTQTPGKAKTATPAKPTTATRDDNVGEMPISDAGAEDDDEISRLISQISGGVSAETREKAFSGGGGDSLEDAEGGGPGDPQDMLMEARYWENQESTRT